MKITIDRNTLADAMSDAAPFCPAKTSLPILHNAKFTTKGDRLKIEANDDKRSFRRYMHVEECDTDGSFLVDSDSFCKFIAKTKGNVITLDAGADSLTVGHSKGKAEFQIMPVSEYPSFDMPAEDVRTINIPASMLLDCIASAKNFIGDDDFRPMMKAIYAYVKGGEFGYCATDTRILVNDHSPVETDSDIDIHWYIEPCVFSAVTKACRSAENAEITISPTAVSYRIGDTVVQSSQTQGRFPDFNRVIPRTHTFTCAVSRSEMADSVSRVSLFCEEDRCLKLGIGRMDVTVSAENITMIRKSSESVTNNGCDGECTIGVHAELLQKCLAVCQDEEVVMRITDASRPILMEYQSRPNLAVIMMPMALRQKQ